MPPLPTLQDLESKYFPLPFSGTPHSGDTVVIPHVDGVAYFGAMWVSISGWLPRGVYTYKDAPPDLAIQWEYRLKVLDVLGQTVPQSPIVTLPELP